MCAIFFKRSIVLLVSASVRTLPLPDNVGGRQNSIGLLAFRRISRRNGYVTTRGTSSDVLSGGECAVRYNHDQR